MFNRTLKVDDDFYYHEDAKSREVTKRGGRFRFSRKRLIFGLLIVLALAVGGWIYARRPKPVVIASYAPETALGYFEINDWPQLIDNLTSTNAWRELAPAYGVPEDLDYFGKVGSWSLGPLGDWVARITGGIEAAMLARSQFAMVITGLEVRGEQVKPRIALIAETHSDADSLREVAGKRLPQLAERAIGRFVKESGEYAGIPFESWRATDSEKQLFAAQIEGELILANHPEPLRDCIDTRLGRAPSMVNNFHLRNSRPLVEPAGSEGAMFGFVTGEGVTRLLRFWAFLVSGDTLSKAAVAGAMGDVFTDFSSRATDGIAYAASFENGAVVDRYTLLFKPDLADALKAAVKPLGPQRPNASEQSVLDLIPAEAKDVTLIGVENPIKALDGMEAVIASRVGAAQSFLLRQFIIRALDFFLGIRENEKADGLIGDEIANFNMTSETKDRVWLISQRNEAFVKTLIERVFTARGATLLRETYKGREIFRSSDARHGAAVVIGDFLALGAQERLTQLIDAHQGGQSFSDSPQLAAANKTRGPAAVKSFTSVKEETGEMLSTIARWMGRTPSKPSALDRLQFATSATMVNDRGVYVESHSPFGNFPFFVSMAGGLAPAGSANK
jgi:Protein of unknown function (DUF3352)